MKSLCPVLGSLYVSSDWQSSVYEHLPGKSLYQAVRWVALSQVTLITHWLVQWRGCQSKSVGEQQGSRTYPEQQLHLGEKMEWRLEQDREEESKEKTEVLQVNVGNAEMRIYTRMALPLFQLTTRVGFCFLPSIHCDDVWRVLFINLKQII